MEERLEIRVKQLADAIDNFRSSISLDLEGLTEVYIDSIMSGQVQKFEFCCELLWKTIKVYLYEIKGIDASSPKTVIKEFYNQENLSPPEYEALIEMIDDRNSLSHLYNKEQFDRLYKRVTGRLPLFEKILNILA